MVRLPWEKIHSDKVSTYLDPPTTLCGTFLINFARYFQHVRPHIHNTHIRTHTTRARYICRKAHCFCFRRKHTNEEVSVTDVLWNRTAFIASIYWNISDTISERPPSFNEICKHVYQTTGPDNLVQRSIFLVLADRESLFLLVRSIGKKWPVHADNFCWTISTLIIV